MSRGKGFDVLRVQGTNSYLAITKTAYIIPGGELSEPQGLIEWMARGFRL